MKKQGEYKGGVWTPIKKEIEIAKTSYQVQKLEDEQKAMRFYRVAKKFYSLYKSAWAKYLFYENSGKPKEKELSEEDIMVLAKKLE